MTRILAWHFSAETLRDGRPVPAMGETLRQDGEIIPCENGLHGSERLIDALQYAPGPFLARSGHGGTIVHHGGDKLASSERTYLWRIDATDVLRSFARWCALQVVHLWKPSAVVREYLETGNEAKRAAAWDAAWAAAWTSALATARDAAWTAAWASSQATAQDAAWDAARAARASAWDAAWGAAAATAWAARAAQASAWDAQNAHLTSLVMAAAPADAAELERAWMEAGP